MSKAEKILVTGAAGHLGSHLVSELAGLDFDVTGLDIVEPPSEVAQTCPFQKVDLTDRAAVAEAVSGAAVIVHSASIHPWKAYSDDAYLDANVKGTWHLYAAAAENAISRIVLTSSIAANGYLAPPSLWPVKEDHQAALQDLYSFTKHAQEDVARMYARIGEIRTIALRPPAFMPDTPLNTGFRLTGCFAAVADIAAAHVAAVNVFLGRHTPARPLAPFEAFFVTNRLPYTSADAAQLGPGGDPTALLKKYWPQQADWLLTRGYQGAWVPAVYDVSKARRLLGWSPQLNFSEWFQRHAANL